MIDDDNDDDDDDEVEEEEEECEGQHWSLFTLDIPD
jgi:hypothetical protein